MPILTLKFKGKKVREYQLHEDRAITIGRKDNNDVVIDNLGVSGVHARIDSLGKLYTLTDIGSTNGTFVNEELVTERLLQDKDVIFIGKHELVFETTEMSKSDSVENIPGTAEAAGKTFHLDTAQYRDLIEQARKDALKK